MVNKINRMRQALVQGIQKKEFSKVLQKFLFPPIFQNRKTKMVLNQENQPKRKRMKFYFAKNAQIIFPIQELQTVL